MSFVIICRILWHPVCTHFSVIQLVPNICPATVENHAPYLPVSWHYIYSMHLHQLAVDFHWCNTHHTKKSKHTSYFKVCHGSRRPSIFNLTYLWYPLTAVQSTQSTCASYMLKSAVPWYYFMSDMKLLKLSCVPVRGRKLKIWYKEHIHNREYNWDE